MRIINMMLGKELGGLEKVFLNYNSCFKKHEVINVISHGAKIADFLPDNANILGVVNFGRWDPLGKSLVGRIFKSVMPDVAIVHGNRAIEFASRLKDKCEFMLVGVAHNYNVEMLSSCDMVIALTPHMAYELARTIPEDRIVVIPNMVNIDKKYRFFVKRDVPVIGMIGRMVKKKGFDIFIEAVNILKSKNVRFKAILAGDGELRKEILQKIAGSEEYLEYIGWVDDENKFYDKVDIVCVPSRTEAFGMVILEAFHNSKIVIANNIEGPAQIISNGVNGMLFENCSADDLATKIMQVINMSQDEVSKVTKFAYDLLESKYNLNALEGIMQYNILNKARKYVSEEYF